MIPKIIHYCWFGGKEKPNDVLEYIQSWKNFMPSYEIKEWNEANFDYKKNDYCREAYENSRWAFVSDYARLKVLYDYGGIYMDTDVEVVQAMDGFLELNGFTGYESIGKIPTGLLAACKGNNYIKFLLEGYDNKKFVKSDGTLDLTTNVSSISERTVEKYGNILKGDVCNLGGDMQVFPMDYFCANSADTGYVVKTENTYAIHHFSGSWISDDDRRKRKIHWYLVEKYGIAIGNLLYKIYSYPEHLRERITQMYEKHIYPILFK